MSYVRDSYLVFSIANHFAKFAERESVPKYYFSDNGLLNLFLFQKDTSLLENVVAAHLHRLHPDGLYFLKSPTTGIDVDFFLPDLGMAIQVAYSLDESSTEREVGNLIKLARGFDLARRFQIVTYGDERSIEADGIVIDVVPAYKFLLR